MDKIMVKGGARLEGCVKVSGSKNAALPAMAASLLTNGPFEITNVPDLMDVKTMTAVLRHFGVSVNQGADGTLLLDASEASIYEAPYDLVRTMRASILVLGPLLSRFGRAKVSLPGGCAIGARPIDLHLKGLRALGAKIEIDHGYLDAKADKLSGAKIYLDTPTVTGTKNLMMAAAMAQGVTVIENAAREPEVVCLARILNQMGAKIVGAGTYLIEIEGVRRLSPISCQIIPDRIEAATYLVAGAITGGRLVVDGCIPAHMAAVLEKLRESGAQIVEKNNSVEIRGSDEVRPVDIKTSPFPGFPTDMQAQMMALLARAKGMSVITETVFENRFMHVAELRRMGADIKIDGRSAVIKGVEKLSGAQVMATDLRASASLILAALRAEGESCIARVYHIDRGYEKIEKKLLALGANIRRIK